jgi:electron transfer flavoprotein alpha subunit
VPLLGGVRRLTVEAGDDGRLVARAECERDDGYADVACDLPLVVTCTDRWKSRVPLVMPDDEAGASRPLEAWSAARLGGAVEDYGAAGSPTWVEDVRPVALDRARVVVSAVDDIDGAIDAVLREVERGRAALDRTVRTHTLVHERRPEPRGAVWVVAERTQEGRFRSVTAELLGAADALAARLGVGVCAFLADPHVGDGGADVPPEALAAELGPQGADVLLWRYGGADPSEESLARDLEKAIATLAPRTVLAPATGLGRDLVPRVAARLGLGLTGDAVGVELDDAGSLHQLKPAFGGQLVAPIVSRTRPEMVTLRPGVLVAPRPQPGRPAAELVAVASCGAAPGRVRLLGFTSELSPSSDLDAASVVVCIGHGLGSKERVPEARALAAALGGVLAATRRVCDSGWVPRQMQIGISGRSVSPEVYLGLGVRGSFNHLVGMQRAHRVIAVNRDPEAEIFAGSDLGVVGDAPAFLAALLARVRASRGARPTGGPSS